MVMMVVVPKGRIQDERLGSLKNRKKTIAILTYENQYIFTILSHSINLILAVRGRSAKDAIGKAF